jgi:hypothetical protein
MGMKIEMMDVCKESWQLFFEHNILKFKNDYNSKIADSDYCKYCENEKYQAFGKKYLD